MELSDDDNRPDYRRSSRAPGNTTSITPTLPARTDTLRILINDFAGHPFPLQLSRQLAKLGHEVMHLFFASNNTPQGQTTSNASNSGLTIRGIDLGRKFKKHAVLERRGCDLAYGRNAAGHIHAFRPHLVISANTPLDAQDLLLRAARSVDAKFVFWLQDIYSIAVRFVLRKRHVPGADLIGRYYQRLERRLLHQSDAIVCIAPEFTDVLDEWGIDPSKRFIIENWAPLDEHPPLPQVNAWSIEHALEGKFCFVYSGTLGMKHRPSLLLDLARHFSSHRDVRVVVVAAGAGADWLQAQTLQSRPDNLKIFPLQPYERVPQVLATASVLVSILDDECGVFCVPSKTLAYLCAHRPLLVAAPPHNRVAKLVTQTNAGIAVPSTGSSAFLQAASAFQRQQELLGKFADGGYSYAVHAFDILKIIARFFAVFVALGLPDAADNNLEPTLLRA